MDLKKRVADYIREYDMADRGDGVLAAVSGGADSVCLLILLWELRAALGIRLAAFHLNHGLRGAEADADERFVRELCERLSVPFFSERADAAAFARQEGLSEEEAGRILRYRFFEEAAGRFSCRRIATAHHKDDNAETVLMNLFRGTGLRGLGGIPPVRGAVIRPLLCLTRAEIEDFLRERGESWREDATNRENVYTRNRIRNELMPWISQKINGRAADHILNAAALAAGADAYLRDQAVKLLGKENGEAPQAAVSLLDAQPEIIRLYMIRELIGRAAGGAKDISERHIRAVMELDGPGGGTEVSLPGGLRAVRGYERLVIRRDGDGRDGGGRDGSDQGDIGPDRVREGGEIKAQLGPRKDEEIPPERAGFCTMRVFPWKNGAEIPKNQYTKWFDYDKIEYGLVFRRRREGDFFCLPGGGRKSLRRYLIDEKVPEAERDGLLLLADGSHILWVVGKRISETYKITEKTETVVEIMIHKGEDHGRQNQSFDSRGKGK